MNLMTCNFAIFTSAGCAGFGTLSGRSGLNAAERSRFNVAGRSEFNAAGRSGFNAAGRSRLNVAGRSGFNVAGRSEFIAANGGAEPCKSINYIPTRRGEGISEPRFLRAMHGADNQ